jgi:hypothetical protein
MKWLEAKRLTEIKRQAALAKGRKAQRTAENKMLWPDYEDKARELDDEAEAQEEPEDAPEEEPEEGETEAEGWDEPEVWTLATPPDVYLARYPEGPHVELAKRIVEATGADGEAG